MLFPKSDPPNIFYGSGTGTGTTQTFNGLTIVSAQSIGTIGSGQSIGRVISSGTSMNQHSSGVSKPTQSISQSTLFSGSASAQNPAENHSYGSVTTFEQYATSAVTGTYIVDHVLGASTFVENSTYNTTGNGFGSGSSVGVPIIAGSSNQVISNNPSIGGSGSTISSMTYPSRSIPVCYGSVTDPGTRATQSFHVDGGTVTGTIM